MDRASFRTEVRSYGRAGRARDRGFMCPSGRLDHWAYRSSASWWRCRAPLRRVRLPEVPLGGGVLRVDQLDAQLVQGNVDGGVEPRRDGDRAYHGVAHAEPRAGDQAMLNPLRPGQAATAASARATSLRSSPSKGVRSSCLWSRSSAVQAISGQFTTAVRTAGSAR